MAMHMASKSVNEKQAAQPMTMGEAGAYTLQKLQKAINKGKVRGNETLNT
jgi:hypothetical protein